MTRIQIDRMRRQKRGSHRKKGYVLASIAALLLFSSLVYLATPSSVIPAPQTPATVLYASHNPITISGNSGFNGLNVSTGISWGSGTADDPYIIEGWDIDISSSSADGIDIQNSNVHFVIRDCYIHGGSLAMFPLFGIYLFNVSNGNISNNTLSTNEAGLVLNEADNNLISNNSASSNGAGIYLWAECDYNVITNNVASPGNSRGIQLSKSTNNTIEGNNCSYNSLDGILLETFSTDNTLDNNTCSHETQFGIYINDYSNRNMITNNTCDHSTNAGIYVYTSNNTVIIGNNASNNDQFGVDLNWYAKGSTVVNNTITANKQYGIRLTRASNNVISGNFVANNTHYAVYVFNAASANNRIWNNTFYHNNGSGDTYIQSKNQALDSGGVNWWNSTNGYGNYWADWTTPDLVFRFGIVDLPYNITGTRHAQDSYPLTSPEVSAPPIPEFSGVLIPIVGLMLVAFVFGRTRSKP
jgi:parallel beta-helix repeat protein